MCGGPIFLKKKDDNYSPEEYVFFWKEKKISMRSEKNYIMKNFLFVNYEYNHLKSKKKTGWTEASY